MVSKLRLALAKVYRSLCLNHGLIWPLIAIPLAFLFGPPAWETNDDVAMSMISRGYGLTSQPNSGMIFSNVAWGFIVGLFPDLMGTPGYTWCLVLALGFSALLAYFILLNLQVSQRAAGLTAFILLIRPLFFLQFTVVSGICSGVGLIGILTQYQRPKSLLFISSLFALCLGYLIRPLECALIATVVLPFVITSKLENRRQLIGFAFAIAFAFAIFKVIDWNYYSGTDWENFVHLNAVRHYFTDFGIMKVLEQYPNLVKEHGFTLNDLRLLEAWFFVDPQISDPTKLWSLIESLPPSNRLYWDLGIKSLAFLVSGEMLPFSIGFLALALISKKNRTSLVVCAVFGIVIIFLLGLSGRPAPVRVALPLILMLILLAIGKALNGKWHDKGLTIVLSSLAVLVTAQNFYRATENSYFNATVRKDASQLDINQFYVLWGAQLALESIFSPFFPDPHFQKLKIYGLGVSSLSPAAMQQLQLHGEKDLISWLKSGRPVPMIAHRKFIHLLEIYCHERGLPFRIQEQKEFDSFGVFSVSCQPKLGP